MQEYLDTIDKKLQPDQWSGFAQTGLRYQTKRQLRPGQQALIGATRPINSAFAAQPDWNWFAFGALNYVHDFGNQTGDVFEASLLGYDAQQFKATAVDTGFLDFRVRAPLWRIAGRVKRRLDQALCRRHRGHARRPALSRQRRRRRHDASQLGRYRPSTLMSRSAIRAIAIPPSIRSPRGSTARWRPPRSRPAADHRGRSLAGQTRLSITAARPAPGSATTGSDSTSAFPMPHQFALGRTQLDGDAFRRRRAVGYTNRPIPASYPNITEHDLEWRVGVGVDIPIQDQFGLGVQVQYRALNSNIPGNTVNNFSVSMGPTVSF